MKINIRFDNTAYGICIGWASAVGFVYLGSYSSDFFWKTFGTTMISTFATVIAAAVAWDAVTRQVSAQEASVNAQLQAQRDAEERIKAAKLIGARAMLPIALSNFSRVSQNAIFALCSAYKDPKVKWSLPEIEVTSEDIEAVTRCIEFAEDSDAQKLSELLRSYQIVVTRTRNRERSLKKKYSNQREKDAEDIVSWSIFRRQIADCFRFARELGVHIPAELSKHEFKTFLPQKGNELRRDELLTEFFEEAEDSDDPVADFIY